MDERADRGEFYPGGRTTPEGGGGTDTGKVDRVNLGEVGESYTLKEVWRKVNQIVRAIAPAVTCLALCARAATGVLEDLPNTAQVVTNEEDAVAMAAVGALAAATSNQVAELSSAFRTGLADGTNAALRAAMGAVAAESNRVDATFAKRSEIPAAPDLAPYALKSELPQDYLTENDITNFATRAWIEAQGYGTGAEMGARLDAQDLAIAAASQRVEIVDNAWRAADAAASNRMTGVENTARNNLAAATNAMWIAHRADANALRAADAAASNRVTGVENTARNNLAAATNALAVAHRADANALRAADAAASNRVTGVENTARNNLVAATNRVWQGVRAASNELARADAALQREIDALEIVAVDGKAATRLVTPVGSLWQDATGVVWRVQDALGPWQATTSSVQFVSWEETYPETDEWKIFFTVDGTNAEVWASSPIGLTNYHVSAVEWENSGDWTLETFDIDFVREVIAGVGGATNAVDRVAYTNDLAAATNGVMGEVDNRFNQWGEMGTVYGARTLVGTNDTVTADAVIEAIGSGGGGTPEWRVVDVELDMPDSIRFVTNGCVIASFGNGADLNYSRYGWPDGAAMFVRLVDVPQAYSPYCPKQDSALRLVGYGTWPTNDFQSVWWRSGTNIFVNILVEE